MRCRLFVVRGTKGESANLLKALISYYKTLCFYSYQFAKNALNAGVSYSRLGLPDWPREGKAAEWSQSGAVLRLKVLFGTAGGACCGKLWPASY